MTGGTHLGVDLSRSNYDTVDGETVILDSETGVLLLLVGNGPLIWECLVAGVDRDALLLDIAAVYGPDAEADATAFLDQLVAAGTVVTIEGAAAPASSTPWPAEYAPPQIERYDDIADIMTMDPIHQVDAALGWPRAGRDGARIGVTVGAGLGSARTLHLEIAGQPLAVEALDADAAAGVLPAFEHLAGRDPDPGALRFRAWSGDDCPHPLWRPDEHGALRLAGGGFATSQPSPPVVEVFDPRVGIEMWGDRATFAAGDTIAHPGSTATAAWLSTRGVQVLHIGAVAFDGVGVLLLGAGGAGKSTTTLACGLAGATILGDDLCAISLDDATGSVIVHSLYATLKLNPDSAARLGADRLPWLGDTPVGKRVVALGTPLCVLSSAPIGAVVALRPPGTDPPGLTRLTRAAAVRALVPTGIVAGGGSVGLEQWFATAMRIARSVDAYELPVTWDVNRVVAAVGTAASRAGERVVTSFDVPVVLIVFNRPDHVAQVFDVVRRVRPSTLFLVADGPRADHPDDVERCRAVRATIERVDWPCDVRRDFSDENLRCDHRVVSGLDRVFSLVDRAIVLEDDVVPDPSFFPWCEAMLDRYADVDDVTQVSGRNDLGRWGPPGADHLLARRGCTYGWATWAHSWNRADLDLTDAIDPATPARLHALGLDPLLRAQLMLHLAAAAAGHLESWDWRWTAARILADEWAVVPTTNLVHNSGYGSDSTHMFNPDHIARSVPVGAAPAPVPDAGRPSPDPDYDGASLLVEIMGTYRDPAMVARLARSRRLFETSDGQVEHFLAPFDRLDESLSVVSHLRAAGTVSETLDRVEHALQSEHQRVRG